MVADVGELVGDPLRALGLALGGLGLAGVGGVEPDQPADNLDHVIAGVVQVLGLNCHNTLSYHCPGHAAQCRTLGLTGG